jgi:uridylate kinase
MALDAPVRLWGLWRREGRELFGRRMMAATEGRARSRFRKALVKMSGEALQGGAPYGVDPAALERFASDFLEASNLNVELSIVVGGGNIFRGVAGVARGMDRVKADYMGMLATVMNALALAQALDRLGLAARVFSAIPMPQVCESYQRDRALQCLSEGNIVIFAGGTGSPFFTTDTAAALRAAEMGAEVMLKGTNVDGVYSADPKLDPNAVRYDVLTYSEVLAQNLKVMDAAAIAIARDNSIPVGVFSICKEGEIARVLQGRGRMTLIEGN